MNPLDAYFINLSHNPRKLTLENASFWEKRAAIHELRRPFNFSGGSTQQIFYTGRLYPQVQPVTLFYAIF